MKPRFIWLLEAMCRNSGVDVQLIDPKLTYSENKDSIQRITGIKLRLNAKALRFTNQPWKRWEQRRNLMIIPNVIEDQELKEWEAQEEWYNSQVGVHKGKKKDKKVPVDIGNIIRASGVDI